MKAYVARLRPDQTHPREIVGFFIVDEVEDLWRLIDECCDAQACEVMELGPGGIYWSDPVNYVVPPEASETAPGLPGDASVSEWWMGALCDDAEGLWEPVPGAGNDHANDAF